jgi:hypothetical protein
MIARLFAFVMMVLFGMAAEVTVQFLSCLGEGVRDGTWYFRWGDWGVGVVIVVVVIGTLAFSQRMQDDLLEVVQHKKITLIAVLIVAALALGVFKIDVCRNDKDQSRSHSSQLSR